MTDRNAIWYIHPYAGGPGIGRYDRPFRLAGEFRKRGFEPVIICPSFHHLMDAPQQAGTRMVEGIRHVFIRCPGYSGNGVGRLVNMAVFTVRLMLQAGAIARMSGPPVLVIASSPHPYAFLAAKQIARRFAAKCVFEIRDLWPLSLVELAGVPGRHPLVLFTGAVERYACSRADAVVSLLPCTRGYLRSRGMGDDHWHYIPNGVAAEDDALPETLPPSLRQVDQWRAEGAIIMVYAGALGVPNHVQSLLDALRQLPAGHAEIRAVIVGRGEMQDELRRIAGEPGLAGKVCICDQIPKLSVRTLLARADIGYISLRPEPLFRFGISPNKLFDYMLARLPVIAAIRAGNDPVTEAGCGRQVDPDDPCAIASAIRWLADLPAEERRSLGNNGRAYVLASHAYSRLADDYLSATGLTR